MARLYKLLPPINQPPPPAAKQVSPSAHTIQGIVRARLGVALRLKKRSIEKFRTPLSDCARAKPWNCNRMG